MRCSRHAFAARQWPRATPAGNGAWQGCYERVGCGAQWGIWPARWPLAKRLSDAAGGAPCKGGTNPNTHGKFVLTPGSLFGKCSPQCPKVPFALSPSGLKPMKALPPPSSPECPQTIRRDSSQVVHPPELRMAVGCREPCRQRSVSRLKRWGIATA